jgi:hypothetical protein
MVFFLIYERFLKAMKKFLFAALVFPLLCAFPARGNEGGVDNLTPPILVDPTITVFDGLHELKSRKKFALGEIAAPGIDAVLGLTRTGRRTSSQLVSVPEVAVALRHSLAGAFAAQGALADSGANFLITVEVTELSLAEITKTATQTMTVLFKVDVAVRDPKEPERWIRKFKIESSGEYPARDATKRAAPAARDAVKIAIDQILKSLDSL